MVTRVRIASCTTGLAFVLVVASVSVQASVGTAFIYQGQLKDGGRPVDQTCDMRFKLRTDPFATDDTGVIGTIVFDGSDPAFPPVDVRSGLFQVELDFGAAALAQTPLWLDVGVRCPSGAGVFMGLLPRQPITAAPYASNTRGIYVDDAGAVGLGTDAPAEALHVRGNVRSEHPSRDVTMGSASANGDGIAIRLMKFQLPPNPPEPRNADICYDGDRISLLTGTATGDPSPSNGLIIDNLGRVGIGTTSLSGKLTVAGLIEATSAGFKFPDGTVQTTAAASGGSLWHANGSDVYYSAGRVGIDTNTPKQALHNAGDYYGKGHIWLHAYQGDGADGTAYVQARDDSGTSSISLTLRTQHLGSFVDAMSLSSTGGVGIGVAGPAEGLWVRGRGAPGFGGQVVIDSSDTSGVVDSGASIIFSNLTELAGTHLGAVGCFKEDGDPARSAYYLSFETRPDNSSPRERMRITGSGWVGIGTTAPIGMLSLGGYGGGTGTSRVKTYQKQLLIGGDFNAGANTGQSVKLLISDYDNDSPSDIYPIYAEDENNGVDFYVRNHEGVRTAYFGGMLGVGTSPVLFHSAYRLDVTSNGPGNPDDWAAHFTDTNGSGEAWLAGDDGSGREYGIEAHGNKAGGLFKDADGAGEARLAYSDASGKQYGIWAQGHGAGAQGAGGYFKDELGDSAYLASGGWGMQVYGTGGGGRAEDTTAGGYVYLGFGSASTWGNGAKNFVQNHPIQPDRVIVYSALEGDEVGTYTRGTARLVDGQARVPLGDTFQWVTNPDLGLTVYVTPRGDCEGLYVESVSTTEIVVHELRGGTSNVSFDYVVYGLRIGFEEAAVVQEKQHDAPIPSMARHRAQYEMSPDLRAYNALERFKRMEAETVGLGQLDLSASTALRQAIHEFVPKPSPAGRPAPMSAAGPNAPEAVPNAPEATMAAEKTGSQGSLAIADGGSTDIEDLRARVAELEKLVAQLTDRGAGGE